jgi:hypothetical protein
VLDGLESVAWDAVDGPEEYEAMAVPRALKTLAEATSIVEAERAYHNVLFAIGNDHAGHAVARGVLRNPFSR